MTIWTLFVQSTSGDLYDILIDNNKTFSELRSKASEMVNIPFNDLVLIGNVEYDKNYNSKKLCDIGYPLQDGYTFFAVVKVNGGNRQNINN